MSGALDGITVLDLSQGAAGPLCATMLGDLGAEVIKVEPPGGEWGRQLGPPFVDGVAAAFLGLNRNKRSIAVDLKRAGATDVILHIAASVDVVLESFRPGVADRLGIGYDAIRALNPAVIYAAISAFGQDGPWRDRPGVDGVVQAMSGIMAVTGSADGPPVKVGVPAADMAGGAFTHSAILAALFARERSGKGQRVDVSLLDSLLTLQVVPLTMFMAEGNPPGRLGSAAPYAAPNEAFPTADGYVQVAAYTPERWKRFCSAIGHPGLETDERFETNAKRVEARPQLHEVLDPIFKERTTTTWIEILDDADLICGPLLSYPELVATDHVRQSGSVITIDHSATGPVQTVGSPGRFSVNESGTRRPAPPVVGEHSAEILGEYGYPATEIETLFETGVVLGPGT